MHAIKTLKTDLQFLKTNFESQVDRDLTTDDYIDFDQELCPNQSTISDKDIIHEVRNHPVEESSPEEDDDDDDDDDDDETDDVEMKKLLMEKVRSAIEM